MAEVLVRESIRFLVLETRNPISSEGGAPPTELTGQLHKDNPKWILGRELLVHQKHVALVVRAAGQRNCT